MNLHSTMLKGFKLLPLADKLFFTIPLAAVTGATIGVVSAGYRDGVDRSDFGQAIWHGCFGAFMGVTYPISIPLTASYYLARNIGEARRSSIATRRGPCSP